MGEKILLAAMLSILAQVSGWGNTYRGAVVEYHPVIQSTPETTMAANVDNYITYIKKAKAKEAEIIVFPEGGLNSPILSPIPDPKDHIVPCDSPSFVTTQAVKDLSRAAKESSIYTVVNLLEKRECDLEDTDCPSDGFYTYNTNVVFDRNGAVIARYAKYNLFDEKNTHHPVDPEMVFFDTDFNVRFGTFICFDILFGAPAQRLVQQYQIKDFVFTSYWFSELPFLTALQAQRGWAETNNVNLLASGVNNPTRGSGGSGIYNGKLGHIVEMMPETSTTKLLIADIPIIKDSSYSDVAKRDTHTFSQHIIDYNASKISVNGSEILKNSAASSFTLLKDQISNYASDVISHGKVFEKKICSYNDFCCDFYVNMDGLKEESGNYTYRAMVFNGVRKFGQNFTGGVQSCGVVLCDGPHISNCTNRVTKIPGLFKFKAIRIKGNFKPRNSFQMPSTLTDGKQLKPLSANKYEFIKEKKGLSNEVSLELLWPVYNLHTFAIWGRDFTRDMEPDVPIAGASAFVPVPVMFVSIFGFLFLVR